MGDNDTNETQSTRSKRGDMLRDKRNGIHHKYGKDFDLVFTDSDDDVVIIKIQKKPSGTSSAPETNQITTGVPEDSQNLKPVTKRKYTKHVKQEELDYSMSSESGSEVYSTDEDDLSDPDDLPKRPIYIRRPPRVLQPGEEGKPKQPKLCHYCGEMFFTQDRFRYHIKSHELGHPPMYNCRACNKRFKSRELRDEHMKIHDMTKRNVPCKQCSEKFFTITQLTKHVIRAHKGLQFVCEFCGKKFISNGKMQEHVSSIHGGPKDHMCSFCGKAYSQKCLLDYHLRSHSENTSPYTCGYCPTSYTYKYTMLNHVKNKHSDDGKEKGKCCGKCLTGFFDIDFEDHECKMDE